MIFIEFFWEVYFEIKIKILNLEIFIFEYFLNLKITTDLPSARVQHFLSVGQDLSSLFNLWLHKHFRENSRVAPGWFFPKWSIAIAAAISKIWVSIILLKLNWFFTKEDKLSILELMFSSVLSLYINFLVIFSLILAWPNTKSFREGWFEL